MGHLYHGYVSHNQRVIDKQSGCLKWRWKTSDMTISMGKIMINKWIWEYWIWSNGATATSLKKTWVLLPGWSAYPLSPLEIRSSKLEFPHSASSCFSRNVRRRLGVGKNSGPNTNVWNARFCKLQSANGLWASWVLNTQIEKAKWYRVSLSLEKRGCTVVNWRFKIKPSTLCGLCWACKWRLSRT